MADQWIVITTIAKPTDAIIEWSKIPGWKVVVVADTKTPVDWSLPGVKYLSVQEQKQLPFHSARKLPWKSYARKLMGYLYAIQHGAKMVYETDDDNAPKQGVGLNWIQPEALTGISMTAEMSGCQNPYTHFGQCTIWPRGYPVTHLVENGTRWCYPFSYAEAPRSALAPVQQGLADLDPDVDAIWRLMRPNDIGKIKFEQKPGVAYSPGSFSPYNTQNTVHHKSAFWALWMPAGVNMRVVDIWRSYWAQRLLWEVGASLYFASGTVDQVRNPHDFVVDFRDELQMYVQVPGLVDFLTAWRCRFSQMFDCMLQLGADMAAANYWGWKDVELLEAWVLDLAALGYKPPPLTPRPPSAMPGLKSAPAAAVSTAAAASTSLPSTTAVGSGFSRLSVYNNLDGVNRHKFYLHSRLQCLAAETTPDAAMQQVKRELGVDVAVAQVPSDGPHDSASGRLYLSIIMGSNNVNQAGQHTRLSYALKNIYDFTKQYNIMGAVEVILVDYNSNPSQPHILDVPSITWPPNDGMLIRVISVPNNLHKIATHKMRSHVDSGYWEYMSKNVGIRRACGDWVLVTNPDILPNEGFWQVVAKRALKPNAQYRTVRLTYNVELPNDALTWPQPKVFEHILKDYMLGCGPDVTRNTTEWWWPGGLGSSISKWMSQPLDLSHPTYRGQRALIGCPGDFILAPRFAYHAVRGHAEYATPDALDDWMVNSLLALGLESHVLPPPSVIFHQPHGKGYSKNYKSAWEGAQHKWAMLMQPIMDNMVRERRASLFNGPDWGLGNYDLPEVYL